jgi:molybdopterin synthase catalytic subunit
MIALTRQPIDVTAVLTQVRSPRAGAVVLFLGTTRCAAEGRGTLALDYEAYEAMAVTCLQELIRQANERWPLTQVAIVHRLGRVAVGEISVAIAVSAAHREPAFAAGQWLIDTVKEVVPIWKREHWSDGTSSWVHPSGTVTPQE